ncbi:MAG: amidohydrolase [Aminobacterium sp.]|jgi:aminobenzoyl-glutamate utilization protein B|nr:amidohydrolase [Aminobacterium sp.]MDD3426809.1 amidohydrolase [Aminobacterium sp.]MDD3707258.1 amidohydrolase [Aminobacterium sp.]MDD4228576.1 amidohydrolase [Aminobacterium sp.]MDD4551448.1 amidohydrolase [Aminobacterium sp.]
MNKNEVWSWIDSNQDNFVDMARSIWENPELGYKETFASELQKKFLSKEAFTIRPVEDMPTAFIAEWGSGSPIVGLLGEFDALDGLSQKIGTQREPVQEGAPGHGCGHNLLGVASLAAACSIKKAMENGEVKGTIRYYGCPAEELLSGKVFMAERGVFDDLDVCLAWHPGSINTVIGSTLSAMASVRFSFKGVSAHAAGAPEAGRSALDAVELMNVGANYLREHLIDGTRLHYVITDGGKMPNIVPDRASVWYYLRGPRKSDVEHIWKRLLNIGKGAALMTETEISYVVEAGCYDTVPNKPLNQLLEKNLMTIGGIDFDAEEKELAKTLFYSIPEGQRETSLRQCPQTLRDNKFLCEEAVECFDEGRQIMGSTDVGDVSYIAPTSMLSAATWPLATPAHSWQAASASGSSLGMKGMLLAAKVLAGAAFDLMSDGGSLVEEAQTEFKKLELDAYKPLYKALH